MQTWLTDGHFATLLVATYLASTKRLTLCNAGHPRPLLFRASTGTWRFLNAAPTGFNRRSDLPLGAGDGTLYSQCSTQLEAGDRVVLYTDLLIETHDRLGNALGEAGVLDIVRSLPMDGQLVARNLLDAIVSNPGVDSPNDDLTVLELCHNGDGAQPPSLTEKLRIYGQVFKLIAT
jgi:sigma-B regulation protein RsbU (phosphoserine phosphatase)